MSKLVCEVYKHCFIFLFQTLLAKAVFDNPAETPDELAFRRGDILAVIEQDTGGLEGWWLCSFRGKQGIAPGNRLKLVTGMQDRDYQSPMSQKQLNRRSWDITPNKVILESIHSNFKNVTVAY